jgi:CPA2 family monovalent cation:H+ antiporter-2
VSAALLGGADHMAASVTPQVLVELGAIALGLSLLARVADRVAISPVPLYLVAGLAFGDGGLVELSVSREFLDVASQIGVVLLLLTLGLEYRVEDLLVSLRRAKQAGLLDAVACGVPGVAAGLLLGWSFTAALALGGVTWVSSSGIVAKVLRDRDRLGNRETPTVLSILVLEDLGMALYLPVVAVLLADLSPTGSLVTVGVALAVVTTVVFVALRLSTGLSRLLHARSDEALLLGVVGLTLLVGGLAEEAKVSAGIGAFLVGLAISGPVQERASDLVGPLRDLFAAFFFVLFGLQIDPPNLMPVLVPAIGLAVFTGATKLATGWWAAARAGIGRRGRWRAGTVLLPRGEFSIVIAGLATAAGVESDLGPLAAAYVLLLAVVGPLATRWADHLPPSVPPPPARVPAPGSQ